METDISTNKASSKFQDVSIAPMHTAEHILTGTIVKMFGTERAFTTHVERKKSKIDIHFDRNLTAEERSKLRSMRSSLRTFRCRLKICLKTRLKNFST